MSNKTYWYPARRIILDSVGIVKELGVKKQLLLRSGRAAL